MAGAIRIPLTHYTAGTLLSLLPGLIAALIFGHQITMALEDPSKVSYVVIASTAAGLAAAIYVAGQLAKIRSSKGSPAPTPPLVPRRPTRWRPPPDRTPCIRSRCPSRSCTHLRGCLHQR